MFEVKILDDEDEHVDNVQTVITHYFFLFLTIISVLHYQFLLWSTVIFFVPRNGTSAASLWRTAWPDGSSRPTVLAMQAGKKGATVQHGSWGVRSASYQLGIISHWSQLFDCPQKKRQCYVDILVYTYETFYVFTCRGITRCTIYSGIYCEPFYPDDISGCVKMPIW